LTYGSGISIDRPPSKRAAELALQHHVPAVSVPRWFVDEGGLMSYSAIYSDLFHKAAVYVDKILKGAQPADLPVEQPTRFQLVIMKHSYRPAFDSHRRIRDFW